MHHKYICIIYAFKTIQITQQRRKIAVTLHQYFNIAATLR